MAQAPNTVALIDVTRQRARLYGLGAGLGVAALLLFASPFLFAKDFALLAIAFFAIGSLALIVLAFYFLRAITCPNCSLALVQYAFANVAYGKWLSWLLEVKECPSCGRSANSPGARLKAV
jgi:hypothetical protein